MDTQMPEKGQHNGAGNGACGCACSGAGNGAGHKAHAEAQGVPRRRLLEWLVGLINVGVASAVALPTLGFIASPALRKKEPAVWIPILGAEELRDGQTRAVHYDLDVADGYTVSKRTYSVYLRRKGDDVTAFDPSCPHLGCHVEYKERKDRFVCPCHGGVFAADGERVSGPPPRGLTKIAAKLDGGRVWIQRA